MEPFTTNLVGVERQSKSDRISAVANLAPDLWSAMGTISRNQIKSNERIEPDYIEVSQLFPPPRPSLDKLTNDIRNGITKHDLSYAISEVLNFPMNFQGKQDPAEMRVISQKLQLEKTLPTGIEVVGASKDGKLLLSDKKHHMYDMDDKGNITDTRGEEYKLVKDKEGNVTLADTYRRHEAQKFVRGGGLGDVNKGHSYNQGGESLHEQTVQWSIYRHDGKVTEVNDPRGTWHRVSYDKDGSILAIKNSDHTAIQRQGDGTYRLLKKDGTFETARDGSQKIVHGVAIDQTTGNFTYVNTDGSYKTYQANGSVLLKNKSNQLIEMQTGDGMQYSFSYIDETRKHPLKVEMRNPATGVRGVLERQPVIGEASHSLLEPPAPIYEYHAYKIGPNGTDIAVSKDNLGANIHINDHVTDLVIRENGDINFRDYDQYDLTNWGGRTFFRYSDGTVETYRGNTYENTSPRTEAKDH